MNSITQFKYKKPLRIHCSDFSIWIEEEFFCLNGCNKIHKSGLYKINANCINHFLTFKPLDLEIYYTGNICDLIEFISRSWCAYHFFSTNTTREIRWLLSSSSSDCEPEDMDIFFEPQKKNIIYSDSSSNCEDNDTDSGYFSSSDYINHNDNESIDSLSSSSTTNKEDNDVKSNIFPNFLTDQDQNYRLSILRNVLKNECEEFFANGFECSCYMHILNSNGVHVINQLLRNKKTTHLAYINNKWY